MATVHQSSTGRRAAKTDESISQLVSEANYSYQLRLVEALKVARSESGRSLQEVADLLGAPQELVRDIESNDYEMNLSELRQFAFAVDSVIEFRVHAGAAAALTSVQRIIERSGGWDSLWQRHTSRSWSSARADVQATDAFVARVSEENAIDRL